MRTKLIIALASLSIAAVGCDRKTVDAKSHDVEPSNAGSTNVGGGPIDNSSSTGTSDDNANSSTAHGGSAESLSGGGAKTTEGATGTSMIEPKSSTTLPPGMVHPVETTPSEEIVPER